VDDALRALRQLLALAETGDLDASPTELAFLGGIVSALERAPDPETATSAERALAALLAAIHRGDVIAGPLATTHLEGALAAIRQSR
jgi:hypothetical protein